MTLRQSRRISCTLAGNEGRAFVDANGDLFVVDGYSSDYVHRFDKTGKYLASFGGKGEPYKFRTLHKIAVDTRFDHNYVVNFNQGPRSKGCSLLGCRYR